MDPLGIRNWGYYDQPAKGNLGLQLMSVMPERNVKPSMSNGAFLHHRDCGIPEFHHRDCSMPEPSIPMDFGRDGWIYPNRENKMLHVLPMSHHHSNFSFLLPEPPIVDTIQMMQNPDHPEDEMSPQSPLDEPKKRPQGGPEKLPKAKKPKKVAAPKDEAIWSPTKAGKKNMGLVINGIDLDISKIATPVCSCTGTPQQCYRWGVGGWQSACCTTTISEHPLPMSTKRRGARIAGRKMSQGAFKKVLEKLVGEGYNLSNPIDLKAFWAKHGTNKFVTIR